MRMLRLTIIYEAMKLRNDWSERGATTNGESDKLTSALNASCATLLTTGQPDGSGMIDKDIQLDLDITALCL